MFRKKQVNYTFDTLIQFISKDDLPSVKRIANTGFNFRQSDQQGWTALHYCACFNSVKISRFLLKYKISIRAADKLVIKPVNIAAWYRATEVFALFLRKGMDFLSKDKYGWSPLALAAWRNHVSIIKLLLIAGCRLNGKYHSGYTPLHFAAWNNSHQALKLLIEVKARQKTCKGITPLRLAKTKNNKAVLECLTKETEYTEVVYKENNYTTTETRELNSKNLRQFMLHIDPDTAQQKNWQDSGQQTNPTKFTGTREDVQQPIDVTDIIKLNPVNENVPSMLDQKQETHKQEIDIKDKKPDYSTDTKYKEAKAEASYKTGLPAYSGKITIDQLRQASDGHPTVLTNGHYHDIVLSGNRVANKTEAIIANILYTLKITFYYQRKICGTVDPGIHYPSFSFFDQHDKLIIWEHLSDTGNRHLKSAIKNCQQWYENNGFIIDQNLFLTLDQVNDIFDSRVALSIAEKIKAKL